MLSGQAVRKIARLPFSPSVLFAQSGFTLYSIFLLGYAFTGQMEIDPSVGQIEKACWETRHCTPNRAHSAYNKFQSIMMRVREMATGSMCGMWQRERQTERQRPPISSPSSIKLSLSSPLNGHLVTEELIKTATCTTVQLGCYLTSVAFAFESCLKAVIRQTNPCFSAARPR